MQPPELCHRRGLFLRQNTLILVIWQHSLPPQSHSLSFASEAVILAASVGVVSLWFCFWFFGVLAWGGFFLVLLLFCFWLFFILFFSCESRAAAQGFTHMRQAFCHWATSQPATFFHAHCAATSQACRTNWGSTWLLQAHVIKVTNKCLQSSEKWVVWSVEDESEWQDGVEDWKHWPWRWEGSQRRRQEDEATFQPVMET